MHPFYVPLLYVDLSIKKGDSKRSLTLFSSLYVKVIPHGFVCSSMSSGKKAFDGFGWFR